MATQTRYDPGVAAKFTGTLLDADGNAIPLANIDSLTLTLTNARDGSVVNSRNAQNVLNANNVTVNSTTGAIAWLIQPEDTEMVDSSQSSEDHVAVFEWTYEATKVGRHVHRLHIVNYLMLCTVEDVRMIFDKIPSNDEPHLEFLIEQFSARAELETHRKFKKSTANSPTIEYLSPKDNTWHYRVERYPIDSVVSILESPDGDFNVNYEARAPDDYAIDSARGLIKMRWSPFTSGERTVKITYVGGLALEVGAVPMDLRWAAARQVGYWYQRRTQMGLSEISISRYGRETFLAPMDLLPETQRVMDLYRPIYF